MFEHTNFNKNLCQWISCILIYKYCWECIWILTHVSYHKQFALKWYEKSSKGQNKTHLVNFIGCHQGLWTSCSQFKELGKVEEDGVGHHRDDKVSGCVFMPAIKLISWSFFAKYIWIIGNRLNMALRVYLNVVVIL